MNKMATLFLASLLSGCASQVPAKPSIDPRGSTPEQPHTRVTMDPLTADKLRALLQIQPQQHAVDIGQMNDLISREFLQTPYVPNKLQGSATLAEKLVVDFRGLDCFTYLDYVEALRQSHDEAGFINNLVQIRYVNGEINFLNRRHFFSDWAQAGQPLADDVTALLGADAVTVAKHLNQKADGGHYLSGLPVAERDITYIPSARIDQHVLSRLRTGDYIGIYTPLAGLDVTHTGLFIQTAQGPVLRNASSKQNQRVVIDSPFMEYVHDVPGIVVLRARPTDLADHPASTSESSAQAQQHPPHAQASG